jgi:hypothetical protein
MQAENRMGVRMTENMQEKTRCICNKYAHFLRKKPEKSRNSPCCNREVVRNGEMLRKCEISFVQKASVAALDVKIAKKC